MKTSKKLTILNDDEIQQFFSLPKFSKEDRQEFFFLSDKEEAVAHRISCNDSRAYFFLQLAYFKCKRKLFVFDFSDCYRDLRFLTSKFLKKSAPIESLPSRKTIAEINAKVLNLMGYRLLKGKAKKDFESFAVMSVRKNLHPATIFSDLIDFSDENKVALPDYNYLATLIGGVIESEVKRLGNIIAQNLDKTTAALFDNVFNKRGGINDLSNLKREAKDFKIRELHDEAVRNRLIEPLYQFCKLCIKQFDLSPENIRYLSSLLDYYSIYKLDRFKGDYSSVLLCCYIYFRYQRSNDILIESMQHWIRKYRHASTNFAKNLVFQEACKTNVEQSRVAKLLRLFNDIRIPDDTKFHAVRKKAYQHMKPKEIDDYVDSMLKEPPTIGKFRWEFFKAKSGNIKKNLRPLFSALEFDFKNDNDPIIEAIEILRDAITTKKPLSSYSRLPTAFMPSQVKKLIVRGGKADPDCYEIAIYYQIVNKFEGSTLFIKDSKEYQQLISDLMPEKIWDQRHQLLRKLPYPKLRMTSKENLEILEGILERKISFLNQNISEGTNNSIKVTTSKKQTKWRLSKFQTDEEFNNPFFGNLPQRNIIDIIYYVHKKTGFLKHFSHIAPRYSKGVFNEKHAIACIVGTGANIGLTKMADISGIGYDQLSKTYKNYFRAQTLGQACASLNDSASKLFSFDTYKIGNEIHASADGQKFSVKYNLYRARYAPKYLGSRRGIVCDSMIANHLPIAARIIGANQHESHYLFDLIFNNLTEISPQTISTDMHGINKVNFALLYMFDREFSPRYTGISSRINSLYGFKNMSSYEGLTIKPFKKINKKLIVDEWDNILKIFLSLAMKETSQSTVVRKLSSHRFNDKTKLALWELDNVIRTIDTLNYLNSEIRRKNVNRALCRGEAYHQLKRAVVNVGGTSLNGTTENEIMVWDECARLITSCIIYYNIDLLSKIKGHSKIKDLKLDSYFTAISPVAWRHINFLGKYEINDIDFEFDISSILEGVALDQLAA